MTEGLPSVDPRRAARLREALARNARMLAPNWAGLAQDGDFGRGLLEIAARLAEHSTSRLDATPLRDKLAFLHALDVATPAPQPATAPIVFTLADKRDTKVSAPARVQLTAESGDEELTFETSAAIDLTPARIGNLIIADPAADVIERAPPYVTRSVDKLEPPTRYRLLSAVEAGAAALQLVQAVGIEPGDLLRLPGGVYRVEKAKDGLVQLRDPLLQGAPAAAEVIKLIALESFALRNLQEHAIYFGHKEMLKLDGAAAITLVFDPPALPAALAGLDLDYEIWGTRDGVDKEAGWRPLELRGAGPSGLVLEKTWLGSVDELKRSAGTSRWVRIKLKTPIEGASGPPTTATSVTLKIRSTAAAKEAGGERDKTIAAAFYNSQPLSTATAFLPFGPEPQRFDSFSLSAPEALSKRGARVTLGVTMVGADLQSMSWVTGGPDHIYGVSSAGRLQAVYPDDPRARWRQLGVAPPVEAGGASGGGTQRFDDSMQLAAVRLSPSLELVFARDAAKRLIVARVAKTGADWALSSLNVLEPPAPNLELLGLCVLPSGIAGANPGLLAAYQAGFYALPIESTGATGAWGLVGANPAAAAPLALTVARAAQNSAVLALIDGKGRIRRGDLAAGATLGWSDFAEDLAADPRTQPAAFLDRRNRLVVVAARKDPGPADDVVLVARQDGTERRSPNAGLPPDDRIGEVVSIRGLSEDEDPDLSGPLVFISGNERMLTWSVNRPTAPVPDDYTVISLPAGVDGDKAHALLVPRQSPRLAPRLLLNGVGERLLTWPRFTSATVDLQDILRHVPGRRPTHFLLDGATVAARLDGPWIEVRSRNLEVHAAPPGLAVGNRYVLLAELPEDFTGTAVAASARQIALDGQDQETQSEDFLLIGAELFGVVNVSSASPRVATLDHDLGATTGYRVLKKTDRHAFVASDRARLATVPAEQRHLTELAFEAPANPRRQPIGGSDTAAGVSIFYLGSEWVELPAALNGVSATLAGDIGTADAGSPIVLPRHADNPDLSWEYHDGRGWRRLDDVVDTTANLATSGDISFTVPTDIDQTEIAGKEDYWIRARLTGGDFGRPTYDIVSEPPIPASPPAAATRSKTSITIDRSQLNPPEILTIEARYVVNTAVPPDLVVAENNLAAIDQSQAALEDGAVFNLFEGIARHVRDEGGGTRALYLGLSKRPDVQTLGLYADVLDRDDERRDLVAEAFRADGWRPIGIDDGTAGLARPGMIQLHLVPAPAQLPLFGQDGWWLRLRPKEDAARWAPEVRGLFVNAVIAAHAKTVERELLGSSIGEPDQSYLLAQKPVLPATLELRVLESLGEEECQAIEAAHGKGAIVEDEQQRGQWVRWREVATFVDEDGDARVYRLDPASGAVVFGDGRCGKIPPANRDSIRAFSYQWGGGSAGNVPARAIANLSSALESVELAMNPVGASGGADAPPDGRLAVTAPALLRHADRALTPMDVEAIATGLAPDIVRARCLPRKGCRIEVAVAIRAAGQSRPVPSRERREGIARNILAAGWGALAPEAVTVVPPRYVSTRVAVEAIATRAEAVAGVEQAIRAVLTQFLHPVEGGPDGLGWPFGRRIWPSNLQRAITGIAGLDRIVATTIEAIKDGESLAALPPDALLHVDDGDLAVVVRSPEDGR